MNGGGGNFYHQPSVYSRAPIMSPVPSIGANSASSTYGGTSSVASSLSHPQHPQQQQQQQYPVCYAQSIVPGFHSTMSGQRVGNVPVMLQGPGSNGWVGRFNTSNAAYSGSSDGGKICNL